MMCFVFYTLHSWAMSVTIMQPIGGPLGCDVPAFNFRSVFAMQHHP